MPLRVMTVQEKINRLLWDRRLVTFPKDMEVPDGLEYVIIKDLTLHDRNHYIVTRDFETHRAHLEGVPTEGDLMVAAREGGYWGKEEDDIEARAESHIAFLEAEFESKKKFKSRQNIIKLQIEDAKAKQQWVRRKRNELKLNSAEYLAHEIAAFQLLRRVVFRPDETPVFPNEQVLLEYKQGRYFQFVYFLLNEVMGEDCWDIVTIREIARSIEWRMFWTLSRENLPAIFNRPLGDITHNQRLLVYWSRIYDSAFETPEPPERDVIDDDTLFDQWLANRDLQREEDKSEDKTKQHAEQGKVLDGERIDTCNCGAKAQNKGKYLGEKVPHAGTCPFGTWHRYTPEERQAKAQAIYSRNPKSIRELMNREQDTVLQKGLVQEQHLRDKTTRQKLGMKTNVIPIRRRR